MEWKEFDGMNFPPLGTWCACVDHLGRVYVRQVVMVGPAGWKNKVTITHDKNGPNVRTAFSAVNQNGQFYDPTKNVSHYMEIPDPPKTTPVSNGERVARLTQRIKELEERIKELEQGDE